METSINVIGMFSPFLPAIGMGELEPILDTPVFGVGPIPDQPIVVEMPNQNAKWVMVFSTVEKLEASMQLLGYDVYKVKHIDDGLEFCDSVFEVGLRVMLDPHVVDNNKTRWKEVVVA